MSSDQRVDVGDPLVTVDLAAVEQAGFDPTTIVVVTNTMALTAVTPQTAGEVQVGDAVIDVTP